MKISVVSGILDANKKIADENRRLFTERGVFALNIMSAPGAGKTSLLERTIRGMGGALRIGVIEGDIQGTADSEKIGSLGAPVVQINTGGCCHLDAAMISEALKGLNLKDIDLLIVENVGNLVCPAEFDLGEHMKVMLLSIAEGDDKPRKYPLMFQASSALVINKMDIGPYVDADAGKIEKDAIALNPSLRIFKASCKTGEGIPEWVDWLRGRFVRTR